MSCEHIITARIANDSPDNELNLTVWVNAKPFADAGADFFSEVKAPTKFDGTRSEDTDGKGLDSCFRRNDKFMQSAINK